ncbi:unnamed protein product [Linum trigynum]|uniref:Uncharacterized protein n=1 Tax=Linum trigynum TaxID=586398 RepID=A0AAV2CAQ3_9ROSI
MPPVSLYRACNRRPGRGRRRNVRLSLRRIRVAAKSSGGRQLNDENGKEMKVEMLWWASLKRTEGRVSTFKSSLVDKVKLKSKTCEI